MRRQIFVMFALAGGLACAAACHRAEAQGQQGRATIVSGAPIYTRPLAPRVVVSEPSEGPRFRRWQRSDPDSGLATTRVEGAYDDATTNR